MVIKRWLQRRFFAKDIGSWRKLCNKKSRGIVGLAHLPQWHFEFRKPAGMPGPRWRSRSGTSRRCGLWSGRSGGLCISADRSWWLAVPCGCRPLETTPCAAAGAAWIWNCYFRCHSKENSSFIINIFYWLLWLFIPVFTNQEKTCFFFS